MKGITIFASVFAATLAVGFVSVITSPSNKWLPEDVAKKRRLNLEYSNEASKLAEQGNLKAAEAKLLLALQAYPKSPGAKLQLAGIYLKQGRDTESYRIYKELFHDKRIGVMVYPPTFYDYSELCRRVGDLPEQQWALEQILLTQKQILANRYARQQETIRKAGGVRRSGLGHAESPDAVVMTKKPDGTFTDAAMVRIYTELASHYLSPKPSLGREFLQKAIDTKEGSASVRYRLANMTPPDMKAERTALLKYVAQHGNPEEKDGALMKLGVKPMESVIWSRTVSIPAPPHMVAATREMERKRLEALYKRARIWDPKTKTYKIPTPEEQKELLDSMMKRYDMASSAGQKARR